MATTLWRRPRLASAVGPHYERFRIVRRSQVLNEVVPRIELVAATRNTVVITSDRGTGRTVIAIEPVTSAAEQH